EQAEPPVPRVVAQDARARRARGLPPRGGRRHAVAERVEREAREEGPREVEAPSVLTLDEQAPARTQHPAELAERTGGRVDEGERAAAAGGGVEVPVWVRERFDAPEHEGRGRKPAARHGEETRGDVEAVARVAERVEEGRLQARPAAGVERPPPPPVGPRPELAP